MKEETRTTLKKVKGFLNLMPMDHRLFFTVVLINLYGIVMIYSASYYFCGKSAECNFDTAYMFYNQLRWVLLGLGMMWLISFVDYHMWRKIIWLGLLACLGMSLALKIPGVGRTVNGATRWISLFGFSLQVAEPIKAILIYWMAHFIAKYHADNKWSLAGYIGSVAGVSVFLGFMSNNMSVVMIIFMIAAVMYFLADPKWKKYCVIIGGGLVLVIIALIIVANIPIMEDTSFRIKRIAAWMDPSVDTDISLQPMNALYAIGSGGIWGKGLGQSLQKYMIPEPQNDFILSIICEEMGLVGAAALLFLFVYFLYRIVLIVCNAPDLLGKFLATGVFLHIAIQTVMNVAVVTSAIPTTGVTLPFISAGGTAAFFLLVELGLVMSVDKFSKQKKAEAVARKKAREESFYDME